MTKLLVELFYRRPDLLVGYLSNYGELALLELGSIKRQVIQRVVSAIIALLAVFTLLVVLSISAVLWFAGVLPPEQWSWLWVPGVLLAISGLAAYFAWGRRTESPDSPLQTQLQADKAFFSELL